MYMCKYMCVYVHIHDIRSMTGAGARAEGQGRGEEVGPEGGGARALVGAHEGLRQGHAPKGSLCADHQSFSCTITHTSAFFLEAWQGHAPKGKII